MIFFATGRDFNDDDDEEEVVGGTARSRLTIGSRLIFSALIDAEIEMIR